jgi:hypothetical protein
VTVVPLLFDAATVDGRNLPDPQVGAGLVIARSGLLNRHADKLVCPYLAYRAAVINLRTEIPGAPGWISERFT